MAAARWEHFKTVLLLMLIATSLFLSAQIWLAPTDGRQTARHKEPFIAPGSRGDLTARDVLDPLGITLYLADGPVLLGPSDNEPVTFIWEAIVELAAVSNLNGWQPVSAELLNRFFGGEPGLIGAEASLPGKMTLSVWQQLWHGQEQRSGQEGSLNEPIDRIAIFIDSRGLAILVRTDNGYVGQSVPTSSLEAAGLTGTVLSLQRVLTTVGNLELTRAQKMPAVEGLRTMENLLIPNDPANPPLIQLGVPALDWDHLVRAFYPNLAVARQVSVDNVRIYTDGVTSLSLRLQDGLAEYQYPGAMYPVAGNGQRRAPTLPQALATAVSFGNAHGGWPEGVYLQEVVSLRPRGSWGQLGETPLPTGYRFRFGARVFGVPLDGQPIAEIEVGPGGVSLWRRFFKTNLLKEQIALTVQPAAEAIARAGQLTAEDLPPDARLLREVQLVYSSYGDEFMKPTWLLTMHDDTQVKIDAWNVDFYTVSRPGI